MAGLRSDGHVSELESDSGDDELMIEEEEPEMTPAILTVSAPADERGKAIYEVVKALWSPRNKSAPVESIRNGIARFGDIVRALRDSWKQKNDNLRKAELPGSPTAGDAAGLRDEVARYRALMEEVMRRAFNFGHPAIIKRYVHPLVSCCDLANAHPLVRRHHVPPRSYIDIRCSKDFCRVSSLGFCDCISKVVMLLRRAQSMHGRKPCIHSYTSLDSAQVLWLCEIKSRTSSCLRVEYLLSINLVSFTDNFFQTR